MGFDFRRGQDKYAHLRQPVIAPAGEKEVPKEDPFEKAELRTKEDAQAIVRNMSPDELIEQAVKNLGTSEKVLAPESKLLHATTAMAYIALATYKRDEMLQAGVGQIDPTNVVFG